MLKKRVLSALLAEEISDGKAPVAKIKEALELVLGIGVHDCHNMDCLFENVMKCGEQYYYVDYEWVFENVLDRGYLQYRMLRYWFEAYRESLYAYRSLPEFLSEFGIREEEGLCGLIFLKPAVVSGLDYVKASCRTPGGTLESGWRREKDKVVFEVRVPWNTRVRLRLPEGFEPEEERDLLLVSGTHEIACRQI